MPEWLLAGDSLETPLTAPLLAVRLAVALVLGLVVAVIYRVSHGRGKDDSSVLFATLVLLSVLIAMVSMVIGNSVARAFSLVGALSIVRFRTVVDDTRDTAFVIFAVVVGMAAGAGLFLVPLVGTPLVAIAAVALSWLGPPAHKLSETSGGGGRLYLLIVRLGLGRDPEKVLRETLDQHLSKVHLRAASTARQGTAIDLTYSVQLAEQGNLPTLVTQLNQLDGVQSVEAREP